MAPPGRQATGQGIKTLRGVKRGRPADENELLLLEIHKRVAVDVKGLKSDSKPKSVHRHAPPREKNSNGSETPHPEASPITSQKQSAHQATLESTAASSATSPSSAVPHIPFSSVEEHLAQLRSLVKSKGALEELNGISRLSSTKQILECARQLLLLPRSDPRATPFLVKLLTVFKKISVKAAAVELLPEEATELLYRFLDVNSLPPIHVTLCHSSTRRLWLAELSRLLDKYGRRLLKEDLEALRSAVRRRQRSNQLAHRLKGKLSVLIDHVVRSQSTKEEEKKLREGTGRFFSPKQVTNHREPDDF